MSLDRLCFIIVEREKANRLRLKNLYSYYGAVKRLNKIFKSNKPHQLKNPKTEVYIREIKQFHENYRRIANLMNDQRNMLFQLRKATGATPKYNSNNYCTHLKLDDYCLTIEQIRARHASYVFDKVALEEKNLNNPYATELYGKEEKATER